MSIHGKKMMKAITKDCNAKLAATFWTIFFGSKNRELSCWAGMVHVVLSKNWVVTTKTKNHLFFWRNFSAYHNRPPRSLYLKSQISLLFFIVVSTNHWLIQFIKNSFASSFYTLPVYTEATWFCLAPTKVMGGFSTWDQIQLLWLWKISSRKWQQVPMKNLWQLGACWCLKN